MLQPSPKACCVQFMFDVNEFFMEPRIQPTTVKFFNEELVVLVGGKVSIFKKNLILDHERLEKISLSR